MVRDNSFIQFKEKVLTFKQALESFTGKKIDQNRLMQEIHIHNRQRSLVRTLYDLRKQDRDYSALYNVLRKSPAWCHYLESTWLINTDETADELYTRLRTHIHRNDSLLVIQIHWNADMQGWLLEEAWDWIKENRS